MPKDEIPRVENEKITDIVEIILYFNQLEQQGSGLKILTPNLMLSRLPVSLLIFVIISLLIFIILRNLRMKLDKFYILCTDKKNFQSNSINI